MSQFQSVEEENKHLKEQLIGYFHIVCALLYKNDGKAHIDYMMLREINPSKCRIVSHDDIENQRLVFELAERVDNND